MKGAAERRVLGQASARSSNKWGGGERVEPSSLPGPSISSPSKKSVKPKSPMFSP